MTTATSRPFLEGVTLFGLPHLALMAIRFAFNSACSVFGKVIVSTPLLKVAETLSASHLVDRDAPLELAIVVLAEQPILVLCLGLLLALDGETPFASSTSTSFSSRPGNSAVTFNSLSVSLTSMSGQPRPNKRSVPNGARSKPRKTSSNTRFISR